MTVPDFMSKAGSDQDLGRGHYVPPWVMIKQKYPGAARVNKDFLVNYSVKCSSFFSYATISLLLQNQEEIPNI